MNAPATFSELFYRYWFFGWLFVPVHLGDPFDRDAARRLNRARARWLPTYMRRWTVLAAVCLGIGGTMWSALPAALALPCIACGLFAVMVDVVALATWVGLRATRMR